MTQGYVQVYTGDGKGKTTAAIGLAIRAIGAGKRVWFLQFMKSKAYSEHHILPQISPLLTLETLGKPYFIAEEGQLTKEQKEMLGDVVIFPAGNPPEEYAKECQKGLEKVLLAFAKNQEDQYDIIILDEIIVALYFGLLTRKSVEAMLDARPANVELVLTGRKAPAWLVEKADLVTEMNAVKHYFDQGVMNRRGIED